MTDSLKKLIEEIRNRQTEKCEPKGVLVSSDLFREMKDAGLIEKKTCTPNGLPLGSDWQLELPYHGEIYVHVDPFLDGDQISYRLPPKP